MVIFNSYVTNYQRVNRGFFHSPSHVERCEPPTQTGLGKELCFGKGEAVAFQGKAAGVEPADPRFMA